MTYEELKISIDLNGYENILPSIGKTCLDGKYWFVVCDDGDCHLFDKNGRENNIRKIKEIYEDMIPKDIKKIVIPNNVINIKTDAFSGCSNLIGVTIPNSVTSIGSWAFDCCSNLTNVMISENIIIIRCGMFSHCSGLMNVTIPNSVNSIGSWAFYSCSGLTSVTIPNSVMSIGDEAFHYCNNLKSLIFKDKTFNQVKSMKNYPFGIKDESIIKCN